MEKMKVGIIAMLIFVLSSLCIAEVSYDLGEIIVTATKTKQQQGEVGSCTTVITRDDIAASGKTLVSDILGTVSGVNIFQSGGLGSPSLLYLRGGSPGYTMVMIDGVEVKFPMEASGGFYDFGFLSVDNIEKIEIVRGPQSTLYGSSAMSGVINIITKQGKGRPKINLSLKGGSYKTFHEAVNFSGGGEITDYSFALSRADSSGFPIASGGEPDPSVVINLSGNLGIRVFSKSRLKITAYRTDADTSLDDSGTKDDPNSTAKKRLFNSKVQFEQPINEIWEHQFTLSLLDEKRDYRDPANPTGSYEDMTSWYKGGVVSAEWQNNILVAENDTVTAGVNYQNSKGSSFYRSVNSSYVPYESRIEEKMVNNTAFYLQNQHNLNKNLFTTLGARIEDNQLFGTETTYKLSAAYLFTGCGTRLKANYGTGFRAPSIYQLYSQYGDEKLMPEKNSAYDVSLDQSIFNGILFFETSYFNNDFSNLIQYVGRPLNKYQNVAKAQTKGLEAEIKIKPMNNVVITLSDTYLVSLDKVTGRQLLYSPRNKLNAKVNWIFFDRLNTNVNVAFCEGAKSYSGETLPYAKTDFAVSYTYNKNLTLFASIDNVFDKEYEKVYGYEMPRTACYAGIKVEF